MDKIDRIDEHNCGWKAVENIFDYNYDKPNKMGIESDRNWIRDKKGKVIW